MTHKFLKNAPYRSTAIKCQAQDADFVVLNEPKRMTNVETGTGYDSDAELFCLTTKTIVKWSADLYMSRLKQEL